MEIGERRRDIRDKRGESKKRELDRGERREGEEIGERKEAGRRLQKREKIKETKERNEGSKKKNVER